MTTINPIYVGPDAIQQLVQYCAAKQLHRFTLIADNNTFAALGGRVETALKAQGYDVTSIILTGKEIIADEHYLVQILLRAPVEPSTFIAVGSGTLTDLTRFTSHRKGNPFISMPTAPSVDGFTSIGAPLVISGVKETIICQAPTALFGDLDTLKNAPPQLIAAGYGDMIGKITSLADWKLGALLWNEPFDSGIYQRSSAAIKICVDNAAEIGRHTAEGVRHLMDALIESGLCMLDFGNSRPASGAEHHASHYWEMKLLRENRLALLHGAKVGFATIGVVNQYAKVRNLNRQQMLDALEAATQPSREQETAEITQGYGPLAEEVIREHKAFLDLTPEAFEQLKRRIAEQWDAVQEIARSVPTPETVAGYLRQVGAPTDGPTLGLAADEIQQGFRYGHYLRNRFTVMKLSRVLGIPPG
jgi:glycerol-1-phosphate dehydrogenase [NAD(P)+]